MDNKPWTMDNRPYQHGQWTMDTTDKMDNGQWTLDSEHLLLNSKLWIMNISDWALANGQSNIDIGQWTIENGQNGQWTFSI